MKMDKWRESRDTLCWFLSFSFFFFHLWLCCGYLFSSDGGIFITGSPWYHIIYLFLITLFFNHPNLWIEIIFPQLIFLLFLTIQTILFLSYFSFNFILHILFFSFYFVSIPN